MIVKRGFSSEIERNNWVRGDIDFDETDYAELLAGFGLLEKKFTLTQKHMIMVAEAEILTLRHAKFLEVVDDDEFTEELRGYQEKLKRLLGLTDGEV